MGRLQTDVPDCMWRDVMRGLRWPRSGSSTTTVFGGRDAMFCVAGPSRGCVATSLWDRLIRPDAPSRSRVNPQKAWRTPLCRGGLPGLCDESLVLDGWQAFAGAVPASGVVEVDDPGSDLQPCLGPGPE